MKRIVYLLLLFPVLFASCGSEQQDQEILFKNFSIQEEPLNWKKVFTNKYEITPLETTSDCLVGMIDKIKKLSGHYYIASGKNIFTSTNGESLWPLWTNRGKGRKNIRASRISMCMK